MQKGYKAIANVIMLMRSNAKQRYTLLILLLFGLPVFGQEKFERERRIKESEVPSQAIDFIDSLCTHCKVKWLLEESLTGNSIEAKFRLNKSRFSVEFDTGGQLQDAELEMSWKDVPSLVRDSVQVHLDKQYRKSRVLRAQIQYSGNRHAVLSTLRTREVPQDVQVAYEIIVKCREEAGWSLFEILVGPSGELLAKSRIVFKNYSNLEY